MRFKQWLSEVYSQENSWLKQYLQSKPLDLLSHFYEFLYWKGAREVLDRLDLDYDELKEKHDEDPYDIEDAANKIEQEMSDEEKIDFLLSFANPADTPTWHHLDYHKIVPRNTWLIHFSDEAGSINTKGFKYGTPEMERLGLTTWFTQNSKKYGGYNFAFIADEKYARYAANEKKYGSDAVMFQASGVSAYHSGDEEQQIIFWGPAINPGSTIYLSRTEDGWCVVGERSKRECLYTGPFTDAVHWVERNHDQYRKNLYKIPKADWYKSQRPYVAK